MKDGCFFRGDFRSMDREKRHRTLRNWIGPIWRNKSQSPNERPCSSGLEFREKPKGVKNNASDGKASDLHR